MDYFAFEIHCVIFQNSLLELYAKDSNFEFHMFMLIIYDTMDFEYRISKFSNEQFIIADPGQNL